MFRVWGLGFSSLALSRELERVLKGTIMRDYFGTTRRIKDPTGLKPFFASGLALLVRDLNP